MPTDRPSFHDIYMNFAVNMSRRSTCRRLSVGCVIVSADFRYVYGVGFNGGAAGLDNDCERVGPDAVGNCGDLHAEENACINCIAPRDAEKIVFVTHLPCVMCSKRLINLGGVTELYYLNDYRIKDSLLWFERARIQVGHLTGGSDAASAIRRAQLALRPLHFSDS